ncbi:MAG: biotin--[acetyl-CoA-carboxylase] ligase [Eggerthellaceae bacterium]|nr:biotin--[acetyl-CoA-carboxylase] ligase [Eggerthellaceae bacterium]
MGIEFDIRHVEEVASTNIEVKRAIDEKQYDGEPAKEGFGVCAKRQYAGVGRRGSTWQSPQGGIYLSLLLNPQERKPLLTDDDLVSLSTVIAYAVYKALSKYVPKRLAIKRPNDIVVFEDLAGKKAANDKSAFKRPFKKLCGMMLEKHNGVICVGIGINVISPAEAIDIPTDEYIPCFLDRESKFAGITVPGVLQSVLREISACYELWLAQGFAPFERDTEERSFEAR